jgi:hypothetical protein
MGFRQRGVMRTLRQVRRVIWKPYIVGQMQAMATCPKCRRTVPYLKLMRHTQWTPVICPHCDSRLHFDKRDWLKKAGTLVLLLLLLVASGFIGASARPDLAYIVVVVMVVLGAALIVKFLLDARNIKLREKEIAGLSNKPSGGKVQ